MPATTTPAIAGASAARPHWRGPLALRSRAPIWDNKLAYRPGPTEPAAVGQARFVLALSHVNVWAQMPNYFFDGEWTRLDVRVGLGVAAGTELLLDLGWMGRSGGFLDGAIERFHAAFGITQARRDSYPRNRLRVVHCDEASHAAHVHLEAKDAGIGTLAPALGLRRVLWRTPADNTLILDLALRLPPLQTDHRPQFTAGGVDLLAGLSIATALGAGIDLHLAAGLTLGPTTAAVYGMAPSLMQKYLFVALTVAVGRSTELALQYLNQDGAIERHAYWPLDLTTHEFALGVRQRLGGATVLEVAIVENSVHDANTPDVGLHVALAWAAP